MDELEEKMVHQDLALWLENRMTRLFRHKLLTHFDHQQALLGAMDGTTLDRFKGRAEVLELILHPERLF